MLEELTETTDPPVEAPAETREERFRRVGKIAARLYDGKRKIEEIFEAANVLSEFRDEARIFARIPPGETPTGGPYIARLSALKREFGFPDDDKSRRFYKALGAIAEFRTKAIEIVAGLSDEAKAEIGVFGLEKRIRAAVRAEDPEVIEKKAAKKAEKEPADEALRKKNAQLR